MRRRVLGAYLGLAIGDALGATVEFMTPREIRAQYGVHDVIVGGGWLRLRPGQVTDDTEMSLALGDAILAYQGVDPVTIAQAFSDWMRRKPVDIGHTVRRGIAYFRRTGSPAVPYDEHGAGNGACMRCLPVAIATFGHPVAAVEAAVVAQAHVTHHSAASDTGTLFVVRLVQAALAGADATRLAQTREAFLASHPEFRARQGRRVENPSGYIVETLQAVFEALDGSDGFRDTLCDVVNRGGDADTTGAILGMIAGALWGVDAIPQAWRRALDPQVAERCARQAVALLRLARSGMAPTGPDRESPTAPL